MKIDDPFEPLRTSEYAADLIVRREMSYRYCFGQHQFRTVPFTTPGKENSDHLDAIHRLDCITVTFETPSWFNFRAKITLRRGDHRLQLDDKDRSFLLKAFRTWQQIDAIPQEEIDLHRLRFWP